MQLDRSWNAGLLVFICKDEKLHWSIALHVNTSWVADALFYNLLSKNTDYKKVDVSVKNFHNT